MAEAESDDLQRSAHESDEPKAGRTTDAGPETHLPELPSAIERSRQTWDTTAADCGRNSRLATPELRRLLALRDGGCVFPMCTDPPERCIAHHIDAWETGGETNLRNLVLLCSRHHPRVEHPPDDPLHWTIIIGPYGIPAARPPTRIDPERRLVHHPRHASPVIRLPIPGAAPPGAPATAPDRNSVRHPASEDSSPDSSSSISPNATSRFRVATELFSGITPLRECDLPPF